MSLPVKLRSWPDGTLSVSTRSALDVGDSCPVALLPPCLCAAAATRSTSTCVLYLHRS